jgi:uncharacterized protein with NRDE domain
MCIIFFAWQVHPRYKLVVAANRDEFYQRPTAAAHFWDDAPFLLAGRDLTRKGTWLGITTTGRFAALTNFRDPRQAHAEDKRSRGWIVSDFLAGGDSPAAYLRKISEQRDEFPGFNVIVGDLSGLWYYSNVEHRIRRLDPGVYGLSNHLLDTPWPKVKKGKQQFSLCIQERDPNPACLFRLLADEEQAELSELPDTGVGSEWEKQLSPIFIRTPHYGTRSSTILTVSRENAVQWIERSFVNGQHRDAAYQFQVNTINV